MKTGDKVVCIDNKPLPRCKWFGDIPTVGTIYCIEGWYISSERGLILLIKGMRNNGGRHGEGYLSWRFVPLLEHSAHSKGVESSRERSPMFSSEQPKIGETLPIKEKMEQFD